MAAGLDFFLIVRYVNELENGRQEKKITCVYLSSKGLLPGLGYLDTNPGFVYGEMMINELRISGFSLSCCLMVLSLFMHRHLHFSLTKVFTLPS